MASKSARIRRCIAAIVRLCACSDDPVEEPTVWSHRRIGLDNIGERGPDPPFDR
jgi:hypothetical protein